MTRTPGRRVVAIALFFAAVAGATAGAAIVSATAGTKTVTRISASVAANPVVQRSNSGLSVGQIYTRNTRGVVEVDVTAPASGQQSPFPGGGTQTEQAQGSGFVYDTKGDVITNEHVIANANSIKVKFADGSTYSATLVGADAATDLAVIKVNAPASLLQPLKLGNSSGVSVGDGVVAIGNPFGLDNSVSTGIVSAVGREITAPSGSAIENAIQTDAAINHGNSGGPLLDMAGSVIGITAQIESNSGGNDGVGFAVPSDTVKSVVAQLLASGKASHGLLGVEVQTLPPEAAAKLGEATGVAVTKVGAGSAAAKAGLTAAAGSSVIAGATYPTGGDVITAVNGSAVATAQELRAAISAERPGTTVELSVSRGGAQRTVKARLGAQP